VGRLDADTTGAIILTNDSELANRLTHPRYELPKTYEVKVKGRIEGGSLEKLKKGVWLAEGKTGRAAVKVIKRTSAESLVQVTIRQGLNRQLRRVMARLGYKVKALQRTRIGNIGVKGLSVGAYKKLSKSQVAYLKKTTGLSGQLRPAKWVKSVFFL
jgi:23S rRNA pseudouridine2605 synthase